MRVSNRLKVSCSQEELKFYDGLGFNLDKWVARWVHLHLVLRATLNSTGLNSIDFISVVIGFLFFLCLRLIVFSQVATPIVSEKTLIISDWIASLEVIFLKPPVVASSWGFQFLGPNYGYPNQFNKPTKTNDART